MSSVADGGAGPVADVGLFTRKSSGLVREIGIGDSIGLNIGSVALSSIPIFILSDLALFPGADFGVPMIAGALFGGVLALMYVQLVATMPRSGGDYVFSSRIFGAPVGAAVGVGVFIAMMVAIGPLLYLIATTVLPFFCQSVGEALHWHGLANLATKMGGHTTQLIIEIVSIVVLLGVSIQPLSRVMRITIVAVALSAVAILVLIVLQFANGTGSFQTSYNHLAGHANAYQAVIRAAHAHGIKTGVQVSQMLSAVPFGVLIFLGITFSVYPAGEVRRPQKTFMIGAGLTMGLCLILGLLYWYSARHSVGLDFLQASAWLNANDPTQLAKLSAVQASGQSYGLVLSGDPITKLLLAFGLLAGCAANAIAYLIASSRVVFGLAFDRLLPNWTTEVSERTHSPVIATTISAIGITIFGVLSIYTSVLSVFRNIILIFAGIWVISSLGAALLPYRRRDLYAASPKVFKPIFGLPAVTVVGAISAVLSAFLLYLAASKPQISGGYDAGSIATLAAVVLLGPACYVMSRLAMRRRGIDISLAMQELPPE